MRVSDGYFESVGTRIVKGRAFTEQDTDTTRNVAVINETFAKKFFKDEDPIGKHFGDLDQKYAGQFRNRRGHRKYAIPRADRPRFHRCSFCRKHSTLSYDDARFKAFEDRTHYLNAAVLQTQGNVPGLEAQVRRALAQVNPDLAVIDFMSFTAQVDGNFAAEHRCLRS